MDDTFAEYLKVIMIRTYVYICVISHVLLLLYLAVSTIKRPSRCVSQFWWFRKGTTIALLLPIAPFILLLLTGESIVTSLQELKRKRNPELGKDEMSSREKRYWAIRKMTEDYQLFREKQRQDIIDGGFPVQSHPEYQYMINNVENPPIASFALTDFPRKKWLISGGWGYTRDDAVVIETDDHFEGVFMEYQFMECRTYEELCIWRGELMDGIGFRRDVQSLCHADGHTYDHICMTVTCYTADDFKMLQDDLKAHDKYENDPEGLVAHQALAASKRLTFHVEGWFIIDRFWGNSEEPELL